MTNAPAEDLTRTDDSPLRILVVDNGQMFADLLVSVLCRGGWEVTTAGTGIATVHSAQKIDPDVIVLGIMLPDFDGLGIMRRVRGHRPSVPILSPTTKDVIEGRVARLTAGDDDYVTEPSSLEEVVAWLCALLRHSGASEEKPASTLEVGSLRIGEGSHEARHGGGKIQPTVTELELLHCLMRNPRRILSRPQILGRMWSYNFGGQINIIELYISHLRRKINKGRGPMTHTMCDVGYILKPTVGTDEHG